MADPFWSSLSEVGGGVAEQSRIFAESSYELSVAQTNGRRIRMDDLFIGQATANAVVAVFDGANGGFAAETAREYVLKGWRKVIGAEDFETGARDFFANVQARMRSQVTGSSSTTALIADLSLVSRIRIVNLGDGRALLVNKDGSVRQVTTDHLVGNEAELAAAKERGGSVFRGRLDGISLVTRSFNLEHCHVSAVPDIHTVDLTPDSEWLVLASDGVFEKLSNERVAQLCVEYKTVAACTIVAEAIAKGVDDNCTVLCVRVSEDN